MNRTACFIDDGYLQNVLDSLISNQPKSKTNYAKLVNLMKGDEQLLRTYYYNCEYVIGDYPTDEDRIKKEKQERFFHSLKRIPQFECRFGKSKRRGYYEDGRPKYIQKQVDVLMTIDIVTLSMKHLITSAKIIAGDADFVPAIQFAKNEGVVVELFYCPYGMNDGERMTSDELLQTVDITTEITPEWIEKIKMTE